MGACKVTACLATFAMTVTALMSSSQVRPFLQTLRFAAWLLDHQLLQLHQFYSYRHISKAPV